MRQKKIAYGPTRREGSLEQRRERRERGERLEGSRFVVRQFYMLAAGGSRELPSVCPFLASAAFWCRRNKTRTPGDNGGPRAIPGSRLLPTDRTAALQSGSPPGVRRVPDVPGVPGTPGVPRPLLPHLLRRLDHLLL
jgi:hypothetical protein